MVNEESDQRREKGCFEYSAAGNDDETAMMMMIFNKPHPPVKQLKKAQTAKFSVGEEPSSSSLFSSSGGNRLEIGMSMLGQKATSSGSLVEKTQLD